MRRPALLLALTLPAAAQIPALPSAAAPSYISPEVHPDSTVTFRIFAPTAKAVSVNVEGAPLTLTKDEAGLWSATSQPLAPEIYSYRFRVDGANVLDTKNPEVSNSYIELSNDVTVPGTPAMPWEPQAIPHGEVTHHTFTSNVVLGLPNNQDDFYVYTPAGYDPRGKTQYPVLYLLHGYSDRADGWLEVGKADAILDSMIASGKAKPMIVVMTRGYGNMAVLKPGRNPEMSKQSVELYQKMLLTEVMPKVESEYHILKDRDHRAIAGLSMGGQESLLTGMNHTDLFGYIGTFSAGINAGTAAMLPAGLTPQKANLHLLWLACGVDDALLKPNQTMIATLKGQGFPVTAIETPGHHQWPVWRDNLLHFTPLLFQK